VARRIRRSLKKKGKKDQEYEEFGSNILNEESRGGGYAKDYAEGVVPGAKGGSRSSAASGIDSARSYHTNSTAPAARDFSTKSAEGRGGSDGTEAAAQYFAQQNRK